MRGNGDIVEGWGGERRGQSTWIVVWRELAHGRDVGQPPFISHALVGSRGHVKSFLVLSQSHAKMLKSRSGYQIGGTFVEHLVGGNAGLGMG